MTESSGPFPGSEPSPVAEHSPESVGTRRTRAEIVLSALVVLTLIAGVLIYVVGGGRSASAAVSDAVATTSADRTAQVDVTGSVSVGGTSHSFTGTGDIDFARSAAQLTVGATVRGSPATETVKYVDGTAYVSVPALATLEPGKQWISVDLSSLAGAGGAAGVDPGTNPAAWLPLLASQGDQVSALGPSTVGGTAVQGYAVTVSPSNIQSQLSSANLPSWLRGLLTHVTVSALNFMVYVDGDNLLRRITVTTQESVGSSPSVQLDESVTYSNYGTPVDITAPTPSEVLTFQQVLGSLKASSSNGSTA